jgi:chemotaxis protein histidine kinase CheA
MIQSNPAILDAIVKNIEKYKKEISDMEAAAETKVEKAEDKLADAETKAEIKDAKADLKDAKEEKKEVEKAAEKIEKIEDKAEKKQGGIREGSGRPKKMEIKKGDWRKIKSGAGKKAKASSPTKMMKPKSVKIDREPVTEKVKKVRAFGQVVEYKNDSEFCKQLIKAFKKRRKASKKDGKRRKTKPVFGVITTSVKNAVSKALHSVSEKEIEKNPKAFLAKAERLEKSAIRFLEDFKSILGSDYKKSEITSEFGDLEKSIKAFVGKFMDKKYANGGGIYTSDDRWVVTFQNQDSGEMEKVIVRANNKKNAIVIAEDESGLGSDWKYYSAEKQMANGGGVGKMYLISYMDENGYEVKKKVSRDELKLLTPIVNYTIIKEYAKGGGINSGRDYIFKSQEPHEQRYKRKRDWKEYE